MQKAIEKRRWLFVAFIDLEKAYDRVNRVNLWEALTQAHVGEELVRTVQSLLVLGDTIDTIDSIDTPWVSIYRWVTIGSIAYKYILYI